MPMYPVYDTTTGEIKRVVDCSSAIIGLQIQIGEAHIEGVDFPSDQTQYVDVIQKRIRNKRPLPCTVGNIHIASAGIDKATVSDLPEGTRAYLPGVIKEDVANGTFDFKTDRPGTYAVTLSCFPYLDREVIVRVV